MKEDSNDGSSRYLLSEDSLNALHYIIKDTPGAERPRPRAVPQCDCKKVGFMKPTKLDARGLCASCGHVPFIAPYLGSPGNRGVIKATHAKTGEVREFAHTGAARKAGFPNIYKHIGTGAVRYGYRWERN